MTRNFQSRVDHVQPNSPVSAGNTSQSTRQLEARTNYLREVVEAIEAGRLIAQRNQSLHPDTKIGNTVYWDHENQRFDLALAAVLSTPGTGELVTAPSANVAGVVITKENTTSGTVALLGMAQFDDNELGNMIDGVIEPGRYYLSGTIAGKLLRQKPPVTIGVLYLFGPSDACETKSWVYINPCIKDFMEDHVHHQFSLYPFPAGDSSPPCNVDSDCHEITNADDALMGWLPADHASFDGKAPVGAKFGYNIKAHLGLARAWPPVPATSAVLEMYQPKQSHSGEFQGLERVPSSYVKIDKYGIWWMTCCYGKVPWPPHYDSANTAVNWNWINDNNQVWNGGVCVVTSASSESLLSSESSSASAGCPTIVQTQLIFSFTKMTFATDKTVVTSLQPATDQPLEFVNCDGQPATTGDLFASLNIALLLDSELIRGGLAFKDIGDSQLTFQRGWITEGLIAGSDVITLSSTHSELLNPILPAGPGNPLLHQGIVTVNVQLDPIERELNPQIIKIGDALEREYRGVTYLGFPEGRDSGIRMRFNIPPGGLPAAGKMKLRAQMFGRSTGPWSEMIMSYYRITRPTAGIPFAIVAGDTAITFDVVTPSDDYDGIGTDLPTDNVIEVESDEFTVLPGETVFVTLARLNTAIPVFSADIGVIRIGGIIVP